MRDLKQIYSDIDRSLKKLTGDLDCSDSEYTLRKVIKIEDGVELYDNQYPEFLCDCGCEQYASVASPDFRFNKQIVKVAPCKYGR